MARVNTFRFGSNAAVVRPPLAGGSATKKQAESDDTLGLAPFDSNANVHGTARSNYLGRYAGNPIRIRGSSSLLPLGTIRLGTEVAVDANGNDIVNRGFE